MTIQEQHQQLVLRQVAINSRLADNEKEIENLQAERKTLRAERETNSRAIEQLNVAHTVQTHEQAIAEARAKTEAAQSEVQAVKVEADAAKAEWAAKNKEADELLAKLREQAAAKPE